MGQGRATNAERLQRIDQAFELIASGTPFSRVVSRLVVDHGVSRQQARRYVRLASDRLVDDLEQVELKDLTASVIERLQGIVQKAEECGQLGAAVGALRLLHDVVIAPASGHGGSFRGRRL